MDLNSEQSDDTKPRLSQVGIAPDLDNFSWPSKSLPYEALSVSVPPQGTSPACSYLTHQDNPQTQRDMQQHGSYFELLTTMSQDNSVDSPSTMSLPSPSLMSSPMQSPTFGHGQYQNISDPNMSKHMCAICGDRASGKHYGVYSCEGCKGFFKRTVRKELQYACRDERNCIIDKRQRNRCQYCRYQKCLNSGMKKEAVQEERQRAKERGETEVESTTLTYNDMPIERILEAELAVDPKTETYVDTANDPMKSIVDAADKQLFMLVEWSKNIPHFLDLPLDDQVSLLRAGWNELLIAGFSHRSIVATDGILLATGLHIHRNSAHAAGLGIIFDRVLSELVSKMRDMKMDRTELGCLRAIVLFNPDAKGVRSIEVIENLREKVYASLEEYCRLKYPTETSRFAKLLLRLPALRSIGLKCMEHLFFCKLTGKTQIDSFLTEMLETASNSTS